MVLAFASLFAIAYIPGALLFRLPWADRSTRAALPAEERVFWSVVLSVTVVTLVAMALASAGLYSYWRLVATVAGLSGLLLLGARARVRFASGAASPTRSALAPLLLIAIGLALYFPTSEYVMGGKDPGTYLNEGVQIAQRGTLTIADDTLSRVPDEFRDLFLTGDEFEIKEGLNQGVRFMGFFVTDRARGEVVGQFPHAFPVWIAIGYGVHGLTGARDAVALWAILGVLAVYFATARLVGRWPALAGCVLLAINVGEVWYARYPNSEVMQQALLFAAFLALARALVDNDRFFGPVAGALLITVLFVRLDTIVVLGAVAGGMVLLVADGKRPRWSLAVAMTPLAIAAWIYYTGLMKAYASTPMGIVKGTMPVQLGLLSLPVAAVLVHLVRARAPRVVAAARRVVPFALAAVLAGAAVYGYYFRAPFEHTRDYTAMLVTRTGVSVQDALSLRMYAWYVGAAGIAAAVLGFGLLAWRRFWRDPVLLSTTAALSLFFFYKIRIVPEHFWQVRRFLPVIIPMTCVLAASAAFAGFTWWREHGGRGLSGRALMRGAAPHLVLPIAFLGFLGWQYAGATRAILHHVEYAGLIPQLEQLSARFGPQDLVLVEPRNSSDAHVLATPLAYIYDRHVLLMSTPRPNRRQFEQFLSWAVGAYPRVFLVAEGGVDLASPVVSVTPLAHQRFAIPEYESALNAYPRAVREKKFSLNIYELGPAATPAPMLDVDVGDYDDVWVLRMFAREDSNGASFRWIRNMSFVSFLGVPASARSVVLTMNTGGRPAQSGQARVAVFLDDEPLGDIVVAGSGFREYRIVVPPDVARRAAGRTDVSTLRLMCTTWTPKSVFGGNDDRQLGVMLDRARIE